MKKTTDYMNKAMEDYIEKRIAQAIIIKDAEIRELIKLLENSNGRGFVCWDSWGSEKRTVFFGEASVRMEIEYVEKGLKIEHQHAWERMQMEFHHKREAMLRNFKHMEEGLKLPWYMKVIKTIKGEYCVHR